MESIIYPLKMGQLITCFDHLNAVKVMWQFETRLQEVSFLSSTWDTCHQSHVNNGLRGSWRIRDCIKWRWSISIETISVHQPQAEISQACLHQQNLSSWAQPKLLDFRIWERQFTISPRSSCIFFLDMQKSQAADHSPFGPFRGVVLAVSDFEGWGNVSLWDKKQACYKKKANPQSQRSMVVIQIYWVCSIQPGHLCSVSTVFGDQGKPAPIYSLTSVLLSVP